MFDGSGSPSYVQLRKAIAMRRRRDHIQLRLSRWLEVNELMKALSTRAYMQGFLMVTSA